MLKDNDGDWALCAAAWLGMQAGVPGVKPTATRPGKRGVPGKPGYFKMFYLNLRSGGF